MEPVAKDATVGYRFAKEMTQEDRERLMGDYLMKGWEFEDLGDRLAFLSPCKGWVHTYEVKTMMKWIIDWKHMQRVMARMKEKQDETEDKDETGSV